MGYDYKTNPKKDYFDKIMDLLEDVKLNKIFFLIG